MPPPLRQLLPRRVDGVDQLFARHSFKFKRSVATVGCERPELARRGLKLSFVATYRLTVGAQRLGSDNPSAVVVAQRGPLGNLAGEEWVEPGPGEWSYLLEWPNGERTETIKRDAGLYACDRTPARSWECDGPDRYGGGNGVLIAVSAYEPVTQCSALQEAPGRASSRTRRSSCQSSQVRGADHREGFSPGVEATHQSGIPIAMCTSSQPIATYRFRAASH